MKADKVQARWDRIDARFIKRKEEIGKLAHKCEEIAARRKALHRKIDRNLRSITKRLDALIAYVNRPASAPR